MNGEDIKAWLEKLDASNRAMTAQLARLGAVVEGDREARGRQIDVLFELAKAGEKRLNLLEKDHAPRQELNACQERHRQEFAGLDARLGNVERRQAYYSGIAAVIGGLITLIGNLAINYFMKVW